MNPIRKTIIGAGLLGTAALGGLVGASFVSTAGAATNASSTTVATAAPAGQPPQNGERPQGAFDPTKGGHQANGITETLLTGDQLTKATDAAKAAVPGATVQRAETDAEGAAYEVHMAKSDGSEVTVKLDTTFKVTSTEAGPR